MLQSDRVTELVQDQAVDIVGSIRGVVGGALRARRVLVVRIRIEQDVAGTGPAIRRRRITHRGVAVRNRIERKNADADLAGRRRYGRGIVYRHATVGIELDELNTGRRRPQRHHRGDV